MAEFKETHARVRGRWTSLVRRPTKRRRPRTPEEPAVAAKRRRPAVRAPLKSALAAPLPPRRRPVPGAPDARIGRWVEVYWAGEGAWYLGRVEAQRTSTTGGVGFRVAYVDGDTIYHALCNDTFAGDGAPRIRSSEPIAAWRFAEALATKPAAAKPHAAPAKKARAVPRPASTTTPRAQPPHAADVMRRAADVIARLQSENDAFRNENASLKRRLAEDDVVDLRNDNAPPPAKRSALRDAYDEQQVATLKRVKKEKVAVEEDLEDVQDDFVIHLTLTVNALQTKIDELHALACQVDPVAADAIKHRPNQ